METYDNKISTVRDTTNAIGNYIGDHRNMTYSAKRIIETSRKLTPDLAADIERLLTSFIEAVPLDIEAASEYVKRTGNGWIF